MTEPPAGTGTAWEAAKALNEALAKAQGEFPTIGRDKEVEVETKTGGRYRYRYADLAAILAACRPVLSSNGLALVQLLEVREGRAGLRTELRHQAGGIVGATFPLPNVPDNPQALGSLLTYLRRYAITALLGIATEEDDDGAEAKRGPRAEGRKEPAKPAFSPPEPRPEEPPAPTEQEELGTLVIEIQHRFEVLRDLETQLGLTPRDWTSWVRNALDLAPEEQAQPEHWRQAVDLLAEEEATLMAELAERASQGG